MSQFAEVMNYVKENNISIVHHFNAINFLVLANHMCIDSYIALLLSNSKKDIGSQFGPIVEEISNELRQNYLKSGHFGYKTKMVILAILLSKINNADSPYKAWAYCVLNNIRGTNQFLENRLDECLADLDKKMIQKLLSQYLAK